MNSTSNNTPSKTARLAEGIANTVIQHRWKVLLLTLLLTVLAGSGARLLEFSNNYRAFFSPDNPELLTFEEFQQTYTKNDNILFVLQPDDGQVFSPQVADAVEQLTEQAWQIPYATRVDSISNFQHSWADGDDLTVDNLYRNGLDLAQPALDEKQAIALQEPLLYGSLIATDAAATGINVTLNFPEKDLTELPTAIDYARQLATGIEQGYPGVTVAITGISALNNAFAAAGQTDAMSLIPAMYLVLIVITLVTLRSPAGRLLPVAGTAHDWLPQKGGEL